MTQQTAKREPAERYWQLVECIKQVIEWHHYQVDDITKSDIPLIVGSLLDGAYPMAAEGLGETGKQLGREIATWPVSQWRLGRVYNLLLKEVNTDD